MGSIKKIKVDLKELEKEKEKNFEERLKFIDFWTRYIKKNPGKWSSQQKFLINNQ